MGVYAIALTTALLGRTLLAFHLPMALASAGTAFAVYWLGSLLFGRDEASGLSTPWRGLLVGGAGAALTAVSLSQTFPLACRAEREFPAVGSNPVSGSPLVGHGPDAITGAVDGGKLQ